MTAFLFVANSVMTLLAGLLGAAGVAAAAAAAHGGFGESLNTAALFALIHAALVIALTRAPARMTTLAAAIVLAGAFLFCGDLAARAFLKHGLFPMAAPTGGFLLIGGWVVAGLSGATRRNRAQPPT